MQISVNLSKELLSEADKARGVTSRSSFMANALYAYLHPAPTPDKAELERARSELATMHTIMHEKDERIKELNETMAWLRLQYSELQTRLLPPPKKSWLDRLRGR